MELSQKSKEDMMNKRKQSSKGQLWKLQLTLVEKVNNKQWNFQDFLKYFLISLHFFPKKF